MSRALLMLLPVAIIASVTTAVSAADSETPLALAGRVGRISAIEGRMSLRVPGEDAWTDAEENFPVTANMEFKTTPDARGELQLGGIVVALGGHTSVAVETLDDAATFLFVEEGSVNVHVNALSPGDQITVETADSSVLLKEVGSYRIEVGDHANTEVAAFDGRAEAETSDGYKTLTSGQAIALDEGRHAQEIHPAATPLEDWAAERESRLEESPSARYVSTDIPGYEELDNAGTWQTTKDYGAVWVPAKVPGNWTPYQDGHWAWVQPWGWTWIDAAPWGFAPSHYGRWVFADGHWGWSPGKRLRHSVYAPAVVGFDGIDPTRFSSQHQPPHHWVALGPGEIYRAPYTQNVEYLRRVNKSSVPGETLATATWDSDEWPTFMNIDHVHLDQMNAPRKLIVEDKSADRTTDRATDKTSDTTADSALDNQGQMVLHIPLIEARRLNLVPQQDADTSSNEDSHPPQQDHHHIAVSDGKLIDHERGKDSDPLVHPELEDKGGLVDPLPTRKELSATITQERIEVVHDVPLSRPVHQLPKRKDQTEKTGQTHQNVGDTAPHPIDSQSN